MKPTKMRNRMIFQAPLHYVSKQLAAPLSHELQEKYARHNTRVVEGDSVKVMRGEFKGIEGKVTSVSTEKRGVAIEGIKREKLKGGSVDIYIHPSNVMITNLNLDDNWRKTRLEGQKPSRSQPPQPEVTKEPEKPKEVAKEPDSKPAKTKEEEKPKEVPKEKPKAKPKTPSENTEKTTKKTDTKTKRSEK